MARITPQKKMEKLFFEDEQKKIQKQMNELLASIDSKKERINPFFKLESSKDISIDVPTKYSDKIKLLLPDKAIDTKDPAVNSRQFAIKNLKVTLENELMVLQFIRQLCEIENYLLFLLLDKKEVLNDEMINEFIDAIRERLIMFRNPINQELYNKFDSFLTKFEVTLNYLKDNRAWPEKKLTSK
jgi:hypothetical protein